MGRKKFERLLLKNTMAIALPAIAVLIVFLVMLMRYPILDNIRCQKIGNVENLNGRLIELYEADTANVEYTAENLRYTGFDYYVEDKLQGAYYYNISNGKMMFFLVKTNNPEPQIELKKLKGKIVKDSVSTEHILSQLANANGIDYDLLQGYCSEYVISEVDYPYSYIIMIYVMIAAPVILCALILCYTALSWTNPAIHSQAKQLAEYGEPAAIIEELDLQLRNHLLFRKNNIYVTKDYMVVSYLSKTDVIRLDYIQFLSKDQIESRLPWKRPVYRLTMSNPERLYYEVDFTSEETVDNVVRYIRIGE